MARTPTGVKITRRFLAKDKRDIKKLSRLMRLRRAGLLTERGEKTLLNLLHKHEHRYGDGWRTRTPEENKRRAEEIKKTEAVLAETKKAWGELEGDIKKLRERIAV